MNLTRDVTIEGLPTGRSHIFIRSSVPQTIRYATIRHMGPRNAAGFVLGRYGLHFHMAGAGSGGSVVDEVPNVSHDDLVRDLSKYLSMATQTVLEKG